jgi:putative flippase GtrA
MAEAPSFMTQLRAFILSLFTWTTLRYTMAGGLVTLFNLGAPIGLSAALDLPLEACIPASYVLAAMLQFTLQRLFVFRHVSEFALSIRSQMLWYVAITAVQYPLVALSTAFLPSLLGVRERIVYLVAAAIIAVVTFLILRSNVFHGRSHGGADPRPMAVDDEVASLTG